MMDYQKADDKTYFFACVSNRLQQYFPYIADLLGLSDYQLRDLLYSRTIRQGYNREKAISENQSNARIYTNRNFWGIPFQYVEDIVCRRVLFQLIEENAQDISKESLEYLDSSLKPYDSKLPEEYLLPKPDDIEIEPFTDTNWVDSCSCSLPDNIGHSEEFFTLYSQRTTFHNALSNVGIEFEEIASSFISHDTQKQFQSLIDVLDIEDLIHTPSERSLEEIKGLSCVSDKGTPWQPFLIVKTNRWEFHSDNVLIRPTPEFMQMFDLEWDESTILDLVRHGEKVMRYQSWAAPYSGDSYDQNRRALGARLQVKNNSLKEIMKRDSHDLLIISNKSREIYRSSHTQELIKSKHSKDKKVIQIR